MVSVRSSSASPFCRLDGADGDRNSSASARRVLPKVRVRARCFDWWQRTMDDGLKQEILETLRETFTVLDSLGMAAALPFGKLVANISVSAGHDTQSVWDISDAQFLESARAMLKGLHEYKETGPRAMWVSSVDQNGEPLDEGRQVTLPAPEQASANGLAHMGEYVTRLYCSEAGFASLIIFTMDRQRGFSVWRRGCGAMLHVHIDRRHYPQQEQAIRLFFGSRCLVPVNDYLAGNGGISDAIRAIAYPGGNSVELTTELCGSVLREFYGITEAEGLMFLFQEHEQDASSIDPTS
jgi:hypothetical protein